MSSLVRRISDEGYQRNVRARSATGIVRRKKTQRRLRVYRGISTVHCFERKCYVNYKMWSTSGFGNIGATVGLGNDLAMSFALNGVSVYAALNGGLAVAMNTAPLPNITEFTALFDQYKIRSCTIDMRFANNNSSINSPSTSLPVLYYADDMDDVSPLTQNALQQYGRCKTTMLGTGAKEFTRHRVVPKPLVQLYETGVSTGYSNPIKPIWIDCNDATVPHYGVKICWDNGMDTAVADTNIGVISFITTYVIEAKNVR